MKKNITLVAEKELIEKAREKARQEKFSLNALFQDWLKQYVGQENAGADYDQLMAKLSYAAAGRKFDRDELNER
ncbi:MAG: hypothetical protein KGY38_07900 [Desulfobacterales bacterium]|nr:hypothetical protein [Desulfobacterales bacterium]